jgi:hypothetical protein
MYQIPNFTIKSRTASSVICIIMGIIFGFLSFSMISSLAAGKEHTTQGTYIAIILVFSILTVVCFTLAERSVRQFTVQNGMLTEVRGKFFKKILTIELQNIKTIVGIYQPPVIIPFFVYYLNSTAYIKLQNGTQAFLLGPAYSSRESRELILESIRPLLENPQIEKKGNLEAVLKKYYRSHHPQLDTEANVIRFNNITTRLP